MARQAKPKKTASPDTTPSAEPSTEPSATPSRAAQFASLRKQLNKQLDGGARIRPADEVEQVHHIRRPSGIPDLDLCTAGGAPAGTIVEFFGAEGVGKNFLVDCYIRQTQRIYGERTAIGYLSFGYGYDKARGHQNGVAVPMSSAEIDIVRKVRGSLTEGEIERRRRKIGEFDIVSLGNTADARKQPAEEAMQAVIDMYRSGLYQWIFVDEANLAPTGAEMAKLLKESPRQAALATLMTQFIKKFAASAGAPLPDGSLNETNVGFVMEARAKIGGYSPDPNAIEQTGGYALRHIKAMGIKMRSGAVYYANSEKSRRVAKEVHWDVIKAKLGSHEGYKGTFKLVFPTNGEPDTGGAEVGGPLLAAALELGVLKKSGSWVILGDTRLANGAEAFCELVASDANVYDSVYDACLDAKRLHPVYM